MASKKKSAAQRGEVLEEEIVLQAVVIADSFNVRFAPITRKTPRALIPLVNTPLLDYTLTFLCEAGIQQIYVYCCAHADQIKAHIRNSKWASKTSPCSVHTIVSEDCLSVGDALRDIEGKSLIRSDFVLVNGDLVSNLKLKPLIETHKARRQKDKSCVMTMIFKEAPPCSQIRCQEEEVVLAIDGAAGRLLHYENVANKKRIHFPLEIFIENPDIQLRYDLSDTHICICSPQVPPLFTDNFDYQTRYDFIKGIQIDEEIMGNTIYTEVISDKYAARVSNLQMYEAVSKDVLTRWSHPMVPDNNISSVNTDNYSYGRHNVYLCKDVTLARGCVLKENVIIGSGTSVGANTVISGSVIGRNCDIGENVVLHDAYIWDDVKIKDNCDIKKSIICNGATIKAGVNLEPRCILSYEVIVGPDITIPSQTFLLSTPHEAAADDSDEENKIPAASKVCDPQLVGCDGSAYLYTPVVDSDDETDELVQEMWGLNIQSDEEDLGSSVDSIGGDDESNEAGSDMDGEVTAMTQEEDDAQVFYSEVLDTLARAQQEKLDASHIILEINSLKHAYNITIKEVNEMVIKAVIEYPLQTNANIEPTAFYTALKQVLKQWMKVLQNYIKSKEAQMDCLRSIEALSLRKSVVKSVLMKLLHFFYEEEFLPEDTILHWYSTIPPDAENQHERKAIRKTVEPFAKWLEEAEEEDSDDEEGEDGD